MTTSGDGKSIVYEQLFETEALNSPAYVGFDEVTLNSFTAHWSSVEWNVQRYRVSFAEVGEDGNPIESTRDYRVVSYENTHLTSKVVDGLRSGVKYSFTVEAESKDYGWIANTSENIKRVTIKKPSDLKIQGLEVQAVRTKQIDLIWQTLDFIPDSLFVEIRPLGGNNFERATNGGVNISATTKTLEGLEINTKYDVRLVAMVNDSYGVEHRVESNSITAETQWGILGLDNITQTEVRVQFPRLSDATKYDVNVYLLGSNTLYYDYPPIDQETANPRFTTIRDLAPGREYEIEVVARTGTTELSRTGREKFQTLPLVSVTNFVTSEPTEQSIKLTWNSSNSDFDEQEVRYRKSGTSNWLVVTPTLTPGATSITVTKLDQNTSYEFQHIVKVTTVYGEVASESQIKTASTLPATLSLKNITGVGKRRMTVNWEPLSYPVDRLEVQVRVVDANGNPISGQDWFKPTGGGIEVDLTRTSKEIEDLIPGTNYQIRLVAFNSSFSSTVYSNSLTQKTEAFPAISDVTALEIKTTTANIQWTRLESSDSDANVTKNVLEIYLNGALLKSPETGSGSGDKHSLLITGLVAGTTYEVKVVAFNGSLRLSESAKYEFTTLIDGLTVDEITPTSARANWTQFAGSSATDYRVKVLLAGTSTVVSQKTVSIGTGIRRTTMDGLNAGTNYEMIVEVLKNGTVLTSSDKVPFRTLSVSAPTNVGLTPTEWKQVRVSWTPPALQPDEYIVKLYETSTGTPAGTKNQNITASSIIFDDLKVGTSYYATVTARFGSMQLTSIASPSVATFGPTTPSGLVVSQSGNDFTFNWNHYLPIGIKSYDALTYRVERKEGNGSWSRVDSTQYPVSLNVGDDNQSYSIKRGQSANPLVSGKTYKFRIVALYNSVTLYSNEY